MALTKITKSGITADAVDATKIADNAVESAQIKADAVNATKIADDSISEEHLDVTAVTGNSELSANAASDDVLIIFDTSSGTLKKIAASNVGLQVPVISTVSPTSVLSGDGSGNHTFVIAGTGFRSDATAKITTNGGTDIAFDTVTRNSAIQLTCVVAKNKANLTNANEPFDISVTTAGALTATKADAFNIDASPVFTTASGSLGTGTGGTSVNFKAVATDPESNATQVTFELQSGTLPAGLALTTSNADGGTAIISGTATDPAANTTSNFVLRAVDAASNVTSRAFAITINKAITFTSFTSSGTFAVPAGTTSLDEVLVVGGGGGGGGGHNGCSSGGAGGAGGLIFQPAYPVTPGGTLTVTIGNGGAAGDGEVDGTNGQNSVFGAPGDPGKHPTGDVLTAQGGGGGGARAGAGLNGGSGGGGSGHYPGAGGGGGGQQSTQSGDSGAYGFGNNGGAGVVSDSAGGGGGAGAVGAGGNTTRGQGGIGKAYTIADGTTSVYYAGGGGGGASIGNPSGSHNGTPEGFGGPGGQGGGGSGQNLGPNGNRPTPEGVGQANKGGGGGGGSSPGRASFVGGTGVVIIKH